MQPSSKKTTWRIIAVAVILLGVFLLINLVLSHRASKQPGYDNRYYDKYSQQTLSDINNKSPETNGSASTGPLYLGFQTLVDHGFTQDQVTSVQTGINDYISSSKQSVKHVSFDVKSYTHLAATDTSSNPVSFNVVFDFKTIYSAHLESDTVTSISLKLYDKDGHQVTDYAYDSSSYNQQAGDE